LADSGWSIAWLVGCAPICSGLSAVTMLDENVGIAVGGGTERFGRVFPIIVLTSDAGEHWDAPRSVPRDLGAVLYKVAFVDQTAAFAVGAGGTILRTTDLGSTWTSSVSGTPNALYGISFAEADTGTVVGSGGTILRSTDGGVNWTPQSSGTTDPLLDVASLDSNTAIAVGARGTILRTIDGGANWTLQTSGTPNALYGVSFADESTGIAVGWAGTILLTKDGGQTWTAQVSGTSAELVSVAYSDNANTVFVGGTATILRTTDGGATWLPQELPAAVGSSWGFRVSSKGSNGIAISERVVLRTVTKGEPVTCTVRSP
jgi:photosystem II stability/assembly factor-like uncharacterized protein